MGWERNVRGKWECNAVFKGGGAKGICYAGALEECERWEIEFAEVAGASAGAITATLVACGYTAEDMIEMMPEALDAIGSVPIALAMVGRPGLLGNEKLYEFLRDAIWRRLHPDSEEAPHDCTFGEIERITSVSLYVITLDLATRQPIVFCPKLTPDSPVAAAVVASSAIPVAFPAARLEVDNHVHRLVDGGTWSNYPAFVFLDDDFRTCSGLEPTARPTIGFILDDETSDEPRAPETSPTPHRGRFLLGDRGSSAQVFGPAGGLISSTLFRWSVGLVPILFVLLSAFWLRQEMTGTSGVIDGFPPSTQDIVIVLSVAVLAVIGMMAVAVAFVMLRLGRTLLDSGAVGASAAMGVGPGVAYWVGQGQHDDATVAEHAAVRIKVPSDLGTLTFDADADVQQRARDRGRAATEATLRDRAERSSVLTPPAGEVPSGAGRGRVAVNEAPKTSLRKLLVSALVWIPLQLARLGRRWYVRIVYLWLALVALVAAALEVLKGFAGDRAWNAVPWMAVVGIVMTVIIGLVVAARHREANHDEPYKILGRVPAIPLRALSVLAMVGALVFSFSDVELQNGSFYTATRAAELTGTVNRASPVDQTVVLEFNETELEGAELDTFYDLYFASDQDDPYQSVAGEAWGDLLNFPVRVDVVENFDADDALRTSVELISVNEYRVGQPTSLGLDLDRNLIFLQNDLDTDLDPRDNLVAELVLGLALGAVSFRAWRVAHWVADKKTSGG
ncbi:patatin-like phospholipase family protein [Ilumatobacter sp.]|uniref:patatin-like phospholipase family protein n=1 Tax=Ilumatobacter sp. TaxID=1967498 RepID=UPI003AF60830